MDQSFMKRMIGEWRRDLERVLPIEIRGSLMVHDVIPCL
jgi:hypothetical protein